MASRPPFVPLVLLLALHGGPASAYDFEVTARTEGYGYQLRRYERDGISFVNRRRITQYVGLRLFNLLDDGRSSFGASKRPPALLFFNALLRFDTDFGAFSSPPIKVGEVENNQFDLMVGALEGRGLLYGWVDFTLGRQYDMELLDFFAFDGLRVRANLPMHLFVESHFGLQVARAQPFSTAVFETDGTSGDPSSEALGPTFGVAGGVEDLAGFGLRVAYRGTASRAAPGLVNTDGASPGSSPEEIWGVDQELVFAGISYKVPVLETRPMFGMRYNLLTAAFDDVQISLVQPIGQRHDIQLEYLHSRPHFDGDSIFNLFAVEPFDEVAGRYALRLLARRLELSTRLGYRRFWSADEEEAAEPDALSAGLRARWRGSRVTADLDLHYAGGLGTTTLGGDIWGAWRPARWLSLEGRLSLIASDDRAYTDEVVNFGFQAGGKIRLFRGVRLHLMVEDNISRLHKSALRLLGVLDLEFTP